MNARPAAKKILVTCDKCEGKGYINGFEHYANGVCFQCSGNGTCEYTAHEVKVRAEDAARMEALRIESDRRVAFIASHHGMDPQIVLARFRNLHPDKVYAIRQHCAQIPGYDSNPGERVCYWAASTILDAWPSGRPYPVSWIDAD